MSIELQITKLLLATSVFVVKLIIIYINEKLISRCNNYLQMYLHIMMYKCRYYVPLFNYTRNLI